MKNKTIQILSEGEWTLPAGTTFNLHDKCSGAVSDFYCPTDRAVTASEEFLYHVDFSDLPPLYPTKGMEVPEEGIEFADGNGRLLDVGENGITYVTREGSTHFHDWEYMKSISDDKFPFFLFKLKRTLPKTLTVCADCFKEVCECKHEEGWYRVKIKGQWVLLYFGGPMFRERKREARDMGNAYWTIKSADEIDWNPINVIPEGEA